MSSDVVIAITHARPTARRPRAAHAARINDVLVGWQEALAGRSFQLGPSIGTSRTARLAFALEDDPRLSLRELDASLHDANLARTLTEHVRDRTRTSTAMETRLQWHDWITSDLTSCRGSR
jgi:hypothetical protein